MPQEADLTLLLWTSHQAQGVMDEPFLPSTPLRKDELACAAPAFRAEKVDRLTASLGSQVARVLARKLLLLTGQGCMKHLHGPGAVPGTSQTPSPPLILLTTQGEGTDGPRFMDEERGSDQPCWGWDFRPCSAQV